MCSVLSLLFIHSREHVDVFVNNVSRIFFSVRCFSISLYSIEYFHITRKNNNQNRSVRCVVFLFIVSSFSKCTAVNNSFIRGLHRLIFLCAMFSRLAQGKKKREEKKKPIKNDEEEEEQTVNCHSAAVFLLFSSSYV